jgi:DNA-binding NarL/FixJ family response regulator
VSSADLASLRFLAFLAQRISDLHVLLVLALRTCGAGGACEVLDSIVAEAGATVVRLRPLGLAAVTRLAEARLGPVDRAFAHACLDVSRGNPFLVEAYLDECAYQGFEPSRENAGALARLEPPTILRALKLRLGRLPRECFDLARALWALGQVESFEQAAWLAGLDRPDVARAVEHLAAAGIVDRRRPRLAHPLLATLLEAGCTAEERAELGRRAVAGRRTEADPASSLTPGERRVIQMVARGMTNAEIARTLFLTVKTIETHLGSTYRKLGVHSRTQMLAALAGTPALGRS